jgi:predicted TIM-barrel fold metal-dependent hydrolase
VAPPKADRVDAHLHLSQYWPELAVNSYGPAVDFSLKGLLAEMDAEGIGSGILIQINEAPTVEETLREGTELLGRSSGRLFRTSTMDPTRGPKEIESAIARWETVDDLVALKLWPGYHHLYPHDARLVPFYEFAARRKLVVMIHQGDTMDPNGLVKFARPIEVDEVAVRFRDVRFVLCHLGNPWIEECAEILYKNPNVWADTSGLLPPLRSPRYEAAAKLAQRRVQDALDTVGDASKFLYGSDWPLESLHSAVALIEGLQLTEAERAGILGGNARRVYSLPDPAAA